MEFQGDDIRAWTLEGQLLTMEASMFWQIDASNLVDFYYTFGKKEDDYLLIFKDIAERAVKRVTTAHEAIEFFTDRAAIGEEIRHSLTTGFASHGVIIQLWSMKSLDLPDQWEEIVVTKVCTAQEVATESWIKQINISLAEIDVIEGEGEAIIQYKLAAADAYAAQTVSNARSVGQARLRKAEADNFELVQSSLGMTGADILKLRYAKVVQDLESVYHENGRELSFAFGYTNPVVSVTP